MQKSLITTMDLINEINDQVKNPLCIIKFTALELEEKLKEKDAKKQLRLILKQVDRIDNALNEILRPDCF